MVDDVEGTAYHPAVIDEVYTSVRGLCTVKFKDEKLAYSDYLFECPAHAVEQIKRLITELREEGWIVER
jgi:GH35 family endo-1,4-beta-xylanase